MGTYRVRFDIARGGHDYIYVRAEDRDEAYVKALGKKRVGDITPVKRHITRLYNDKARAKAEMR